MGATLRCQKKCLSAALPRLPKQAPVGNGKRPRAVSLSEGITGSAMKLRAMSGATLAGTPVPVQQTVDGIQRAYHGFRGFVGHQPGHWQGQIFQNPALARNGDAAAHGSTRRTAASMSASLSPQTTILCESWLTGGCHSRVAQAVSCQNAHAHLASGLVAFHNCQLAQTVVLAGVKKSIGAGDVMLFGIRHQRTGVQADNPCAARRQGQSKHVIRQGRKPHRYWSGR